MFGDFGNDHADFLFKTERVTEARHPPVQARPIHRSQLRQWHRDLRARRTHSWELMDSARNLGLNVVRAELCLRHALAYRKAAGRQQLLVAGVRLRRVGCRHSLRNSA